MGTMGAVTSPHTTYHYQSSGEIESRIFIFHFYMVLLAFEVSCNFRTFDPIICDYSLPPTANNYTIVIT